MTMPRIACLSLVLALLSPAAAYGACPAQAPTPVHPANESKVTSPVTFEWTAVQDTETYYLSVWDDVTGEDVYEQELSGTTTSVSFPPGNYGWVIEADADDCETLVSEDRYFVVPRESCPEPTELISPTEESVQSSAVHFEWSPVQGVSEYFFYLYRDGELEKEDTLTSTSIDLELEPGTYDWGVDIDLPGCGLLESYSYFFVPGGECPDDGPVIESPALFAEVSSTVEFRWTPVEGASAYWFYLESDAGDVIADQQVSSTSLTFELAPEEYYWAVEAEVPGCPYTDSEGVFRVTCGKGSPGLISPSEAAELTSPVAFQWSAVEGVEGYYLVVLLYDEYYVEEFVDETSFELDLPGGEFEWFVEAVYEEGCPPESSDSRTFTIAGGEDCGTASPQLLTPSEGATITSTPVQFSWTPVDGAFEYWITVAEDGEDFELYDVTDLTSALVALGPGEYEWKVVALFDGCAPVESDIGTFTFPGDPSCEPDDLELVSPVDDAILTGAVDLEWSPVADAVEYIVFLESFDGYPSPVATTTETKLSLGTLPSGEYYWWVIAILPACAPAESDYRYFEVPFNEACDHELPYLLSPREGAANVPSNVTLEWTAVPDATGYQVWVAVDGGDYDPAGPVVSEPRLETTVPVGRIEWFVEALFTAGCPSETSEDGSFLAIEDQSACGISARPELTAVGSVLSGQRYALYWTAVPGAASYEVQESKDTQFLTNRSITTTTTSATFTTSTDDPSLRHYRVRAIDRCEQPGPFSPPSVVVVEPQRRADASRFELVTGVSELAPVRQSLFIPGSGSTSSRSVRASGGRSRPVRRPATGATFSVTTDVPWLRAVPRSGSLPPEGITISLEADPSRLPAGTFAGNVSVATSAAGKTASNGTSASVSLSIVTPVGAGFSSSISPETLVIPLVRGGRDGTSNVEVSNLSPVKRSWELQFVPAGEDGFRRSKKTTVQLEPGTTIQLQNLMRTWFGVSSSENIEGALSIRPLDPSGNKLGTGPTFLAASMIASTADLPTISTIPSLSLGRFLSSGTDGRQTLIVPDLRSGNGSASAISLVEGSGNPATALVRVIGSGGQVLGESSVTLQPFEQRTIRDLLDGISVENARAEVTLSSGDGRLNAIGLVRDDRSGDERVVRPTDASQAMSGERYILGVASETVSTGRSRVTTLWLYNTMDQTASVALRFEPEDGTPALEGTVTLAAGESKRFDDLTSLLPITGKSGIIVVSQASGVVIESSLALRGAGGELSNSLPVINPGDATQRQGRTLQILQMEESGARSSALGLAELAGAPATIDISAVVPGSKVSPSVTISLAAHEIRTIDAILQKLGVSGAGRARLSVRVREGAGRVTAWGSVTERSSFETTIIGAE